MTQTQIKSIFLVPLLIGLIFLYGFNAIMVLFDSNYTIQLFLDLEVEKAGTVGFLGVMCIYTSALIALFSISFIIVGLLKKEFIPHSKSSTFLVWGVFSAITSMVLYGLSVNLVGNHSLAAKLFFFSMLLFMLIWYIESNTPAKCSFFDKVKLLPIYLLLIYTMGLPGFKKLFHSSTVMGSYVEMFGGSILSKLPGGVPPLIYLLGALEIIVALLLIISIIRIEFTPNKDRIYLRYGLFVMVTTFIMLSFGMVTLLNFQKALELLMYAIFTTFFYAYIESENSKRVAVPLHE